MHLNKPAHEVSHLHKMLSVRSFIYRLLSLSSNILHTFSYATQMHSYQILEQFQLCHPQNQFKHNKHLLYRPSLQASHKPAILTNMSALLFRETSFTIIIIFDFYSRSLFIFCCQDTKQKWIAVLPSPKLNTAMHSELLSSFESIYSPSLSHLKIHLI